MFERFDGPARELVTRAARIAASSRATEVRPEHLLASLLQDAGSTAVAVLESLGVTAEQLGHELDERRVRYGGGLDEDDAQALAAIGIDLDEVLRRFDGPDSRPPDDNETSPARGWRGIAGARFTRASRKAIASRCASRSRYAAPPSAPSTCCSVLLAQTTPRCGTACSRSG